MPFFNNNSKKTERKKELMQQLVARSKKAICGLTEREVVVSSENVGRAIAAIKRSGKIYVGKSESRGGKTTIWFSSTSF